MRLASWGKVIGIVALILASAAVAAEMTGEDLPSAAVRYKMTVTVDTPEGPKSGSSVREVHMFTQPKIPGMPGSGEGAVNFKGEAVTVDLGKRGKLFALLRNASGPDYAYYILFNSFQWPGGPGGALTKDGIRYYQTLKSGKKLIEPEDYPMMVTFRDMKAPKTVELAYKNENIPVQEKGNNYISDRNVITDNLEKLFGKGVVLKSVEIEITQEPVTWGIEKFIPWLPERKNIPGTLGGTPERPFDDPTKTYLNGIEFSEGRFW